MKNAILYAFIVAMGGFIFGLDAALISGTVSYISQEFQLSDLELGMAVSAPGWGVLIALLLAGYVSNRYGRKKAIQIVAVLYLISAVGSAFATSYWMLVSARLLGGLAFTSLSLASMYIGEIAPPKLRGKLVSITQINIGIGLSGAYFINYYLVKSVNAGAAWTTQFGVDDNVWRWMLGSEILPVIAWMFLVTLIPKSPSWLIYKGRKTEAKDVLRKVLPESEIDAHISEMEESMRKSAEDRSIKSQLSELMSKPMRVTLIIAVTIAIAQQATGINAILFYAPTVFEQLGMGTDGAFTQTLWIGLTGLVFTVAGLMLVDKLGRRPLIIYGMLWIVLSLGLCAFGFSQATYSLTVEDLTALNEIQNVNQLESMIGKVYDSDIAFKEQLTNALGLEEARTHSSSLLQLAADMNGGLILFGILSFIAAFHFSVGPVMWVLFSEIFPISTRGIAIPGIAFVTSTVSVLVQNFFPWQLANMGGTSIFLFYAVAVLIGMLILAKYLVETKNLSIEEIQNKLTGQ
ncbi:MAG: sugar porter family MFS transporter [Cyclobacteriaceae bacterium]